MELDKYTRVVPKLELTLPGRTLNATYRNFDKAHVFCSSSSFQQAAVDVCMSNRSRVTAGFSEDGCTYPSREWETLEEVDKKMEDAFNDWKHGKCNAVLTQ